MLNKLSRKDIELLNALAQTPEGKSALYEYIEQHEKAVKAYKVYRESVVAEVEVDKVVKPVGTKRKFKAGDKVRVLSGKSNIATTKLRVGDITEVICYKGDDSKYAALDPNFRTVVVLDLLDASGQGFFEEYALELVEEKSPNELRAEIIQRAKEFVRENKKTVFKKKSHYFVVGTSFIVNARKRTVVALVKDIVFREVQFKGIAKCNPDDVFNEHIGKAIALGRALGKDVSEFENAVQPDEVVVGHVAKGNEVSGPYRQDRKFTLTSKRECDSFYYAENSCNDFIYSGQIGAIIDDTNAIYEGGVE